MKSWGQRGIAMVTVLLVGAALTVVASTATFVTIEELRSGGDDRRAAQALAYAEAGIDSFMQRIKGSDWTWKQLASSGCGSNALVTIGGDGPGDIGRGFYTAEVRPEICRNPVPRPSSRTAVRLAITSTGEHPTARRVVRQVIELKPKGLPVGVFALNNINVGGNLAERRISLITGTGDIYNRDKIAFHGLDPYYTMGDFYPGVANPSAAVPAAAHAAGQIRLCSQPGCVSVEHPPSPNCSSNSTTGASGGGSIQGQSAWDGSSAGSTSPSTSSPTGDCLTYSNAGGTPGAGAIFPPSNRFTSAHPLARSPAPVFTEDERRALRSSAQANGIYCNYSYTNNTQTASNCTKAGAPMTCAANPSAGGGANSCGIRTSDIQGLPNNFVAWFDFPKTKPNGQSSNPEDFPAHTVSWNADVTGCSNDPDLSRSVVIWVNWGSLNIEANRSMTGGIFALDGKVSTFGGAEVYGTIISKNVDMAGNSNFRLDECWVENMPAPFLKVTPISWTEVDR